MGPTTPMTRYLPAMAASLADRAGQGRQWRGVSTGAAPLTFTVSTRLVTQTTS